MFSYWGIGKLKPALPYCICQLPALLFYKNALLVLRVYDILSPLYIASFVNSFSSYADRRAFEASTSRRSASVATTNTNINTGTSRNKRERDGKTGSKRDQTQTATVCDISEAQYSDITDSVMRLQPIVTECPLWSAYVKGNGGRSRSRDTHQPKELAYLENAFCDLR